MIPTLHFKNAKEINIQQNINKDFLDDGNMGAFYFLVICLFSIFSIRTIYYPYIQEKILSFKKMSIYYVPGASARHYFEGL